MILNWWDLPPSLSGELYTVTFTLETASVSSYSADAVLTAIETWADTVVSALA